MSALQLAADILVGVVLCLLFAAVYVAVKVEQEEKLAGEQKRREVFMSWRFMYAGDADAVAKKVAQETQFPQEFKVAVAGYLALMKSRQPELVKSGYQIAAADKYRVESDGHLDDISGGNVTLRIERLTVLLDPPAEAPKEEGPA